MRILFVKRLAVRDTSLIWRKRGEEQRGANVESAHGKSHHMFNTMGRT
jgi:hypothetical protein